MELAQLAVFVRPPISGTVKTRLALRFGEAGAAQLYQAFVEDTVALCARVRAAGRIDLALWSAGPAPIVSEWAERLGTSPRIQPEGDLGVRLSAAFDEGLRRYERVVVIGSDMPTLPIELMTAAITRSGPPRACSLASKGFAGLPRAHSKTPLRQTPQGSRRSSHLGTTSTCQKTWRCCAPIFRSTRRWLPRPRSASPSSIAPRGRASSAVPCRPAVCEKASGRPAPRR